MSLRHLRHIAEYLAVRLLIALIQSLSIETCQSLARFVAWLAGEVLQIRGPVVRENLEIAFPDATPAERRRISRQMWEHLLLMVCEIALAPRKIHDTNWHRHFTFHRWPDLTRMFHNPRPVVVVTAHFGNFEVAGYLTGFWGFRTYTVARTLDNPYLDRFVNRFRESMGQRMLPTQQSAEMADELLADGGKLVLVGDQNAGGKGVWVEFLGRHASCHKALALFSLLNRAPMGVITAKRTHKPLHFEIGLVDYFDPLAPGNEELHDITALTQWYNDAMEREIRKAPHQYWWLHRRWKETAPARTKRRRKPRPPAPVAQPQSDIQRDAA